ncbi:hypothetical protein [Sphingomonas sp. LR55]|uniref:hypothetical protein n=1 Tax=Sphingomonas sp. LR55 TaxID=3050231 RepID=UPI003FA77F9E
MVLGTGTAVTVGAILLLAILGGLALLYLGMRARADATETVEANAQLRTIIDGSPAIVTVIRSGGRIEMTQRMADWLGLDVPPRSLAELATGGTSLSPDDAARLIADVTAAQRSGRAFVRSVRLQGSTRDYVSRGPSPRRDGRRGCGAALGIRRDR